MKGKLNKYLVLSIVFFFLFFLMIVLVKTVDVKAIGPNGSTIGLASINEAFFNLVGVNILSYKISEILGYTSILICACFGFLGFLQLVSRKNFFKVDKEILILGGTYIITILSYVIFLFVGINYRPVLEDGKLEPSFPSSHTVLAVVTSITAIFVLDKYVKNKKTTMFIRIALITFAFISTLLRFLSGFHWLSDIIAGLILSSSIVFLFLYVNSVVPSNS